MHFDTTTTLRFLIVIGGVTATAACGDGGFPLGDDVDAPATKAASGAAGPAGSGGSGPTGSGAGTGADATSASSGAPGTTAGSGGTTSASGPSSSSASTGGAGGAGGAFDPSTTSSTGSTGGTTEVGPTSATATSSASTTGTGGTGGSGGSTDVGTTSGAGAGDVVGCTSSFAERLTVSAVPVDVAVESSTLWPWTPDQSPKLGATSAGARIAWPAVDGTVHVTPISLAGTRTGPDAVTTGDLLRGHVALDDGAALLVVRGEAMVLVRLDVSGAAVFETTVVAGGDHGIQGTKWIDDWSDWGALGWDGASFAPYFGHTMNWGGSGNHQGDWYGFFDPQGGALPGGWGWGCSHSIDERIVRAPGGYLPICMSDCYPQKGIVLGNATLLRSEPSGNCAGTVDAELGGVVVRDDRTFVSFTSAEGRASLDVGVLTFAAAGTDATWWLTDTAGVAEHSPHLAAYGDNLLAVWADAEGVVALELDRQGGVIRGPERLPGVAIGHRDDVVALADGSLAWAFVDPLYGSTEIKVARLRACD